MISNWYNDGYEYQAMIIQLILFRISGYGYSGFIIMIWIYHYRYSRSQNRIWAYNTLYKYKFKWISIFQSYYGCGWIVVACVCMSCSWDLIVLLKVLNHRIIEDYSLSICIDVMVVTIYWKGIQCTSYLSQTTSSNMSTHIKNQNKKLHIKLISS